MKELFKCGDVGFESKIEAKAYRDAHGGVEKGLYISKGKEHQLFGVKGNPRTHSHNNRSGGAGTGFPKGKR